MEPAIANRVSLDPAQLRSVLGLVERDVKAGRWRAASELLDLLAINVPMEPSIYRARAALLRAQGRVLAAEVQEAVASWVA